MQIQVPNGYLELGNQEYWLFFLPCYLDPILLEVHIPKLDCTQNSYIQYYNPVFLILLLEICMWNIYFLIVYLLAYAVNDKNQ